MYDADDDAVDHKKLEQLREMKLDFKPVSEDKETITVYLNIKPKQEKEAQRNIAGPIVSDLQVFVLIF